MVVFVRLQEDSEGKCSVGLLSKDSELHRSFVKLHSLYSL